MLFRVVRPVRRKGSRVPYFVQRIPADVKARAAGIKLTIPLGDSFHRVALRAGANDIRFSLRTADPSEAKVRHAVVAAHLETVWRALRERSPASLTHRQATALAGELYRAWADGEDHERTIAVEYSAENGWQRADVSQDERVALWESVQEHWEALHQTGESFALEQPLGPLVDRLLLARGIQTITAESRGLVLCAFWAALRDAFATRKRNAEGDYSPDSKAGRFPEWTPPQPTKIAALASPKVSLNGLVERWWVEAKATGRKPSTNESYTNTMAAFVSYLGHDDANRVMRHEVIGFKDHRLATINPRNNRPISAKTVKDMPAHPPQHRNRVVR